MEAGVESVGGQKLRVGAAFYDATVFENDEA
jgi:hypothetical protein